MDLSNNTNSNTNNNINSIDLIQYDKECNYLDSRTQNANIMLDKCVKDNSNILG